MLSSTDASNIDDGVSLSQPIESALLRRGNVKSIRNHNILPLNPPILSAKLQFPRLRFTPIIWKESQGLYDSTSFFDSDIFSVVLVVFFVTISYIMIRFSSRKVAIKEEFDLQILVPQALEYKISSPKVSNSSRTEGLRCRTPSSTKTPTTPRW
jgi:hypothetical protein